MRSARLSLAVRSRFSRMLLDTLVGTFKPRSALPEADCECVEDGGSGRRDADGNRSPRSPSLPMSPAPRARDAEPVGEPGPPACGSDCDDTDAGGDGYGAGAARIVPADIADPGGGALTECAIEPGPCAPALCIDLLALTAGSRTEYARRTLPAGVPACESEYVRSRSRLPCRL